MPHVFACHAPYVVTDPFQVYCFLESIYRCRRPRPEAQSCIDSFQPHCLRTNLAPADPTHGNAAIDGTRREFSASTVTSVAGVTNFVQVVTK